MKLPNRKAFFVASALATGTIALPAAAQSAGDAEQVNDAATNPIIVTARKKTENLQEVPTTVAVVSADTIANLTLDDVSDLSKVTAGLTLDAGLGRDANRHVIRGQANILGASGVAIFIDGIYFSGSIADYNIDNIERVEVVKGPQSALYGRNTYSGAINIISKSTADALEGSIQADVSEHDRYDLTASIRAPIGDSLTAFLSGRYFENGGEYTNLFDGDKVGQQQSWSVSGGLAYDGGGPLTAQARIYYNETDDGQPAVFATSSADNNCLFDNGSFYGGRGRYFCGTIEPGEINTDYSRQFADPDDVGLRLNTLNASLRFDYELSDQLTLTSLTGYNDVENTLVTDGDYGPNSFQPATFATFPAGGGTGLGIVNGPPIDFSFGNTSNTKDISQELRLSYDGDRFDLLIGGYYFDQSDDNFDIRTLPADANARAEAQSTARQNALCSPLAGCFFSFFVGDDPNTVIVPRNQNQLDIRNIALFGAVSFDVTDRLTIGVEGRYSEERIDQVAISQNLGEAISSTTSASATFKDFAPRVLIDFQATDDNLLYAIYAQGQKPGGFNGALAIQANQPTFDPEDVTSYEIGSKNTFLDGALTANLALFYNEIEGYQLTQTVFLPPNTISSIVNAGDAEILGLELELVARPTNRLTLTANYSLADSKFTSGVDENQGVLNDVADDGLVNCSTGDQFPDVAGCDSLFGSIVGKSIPRAPKHQIFADLDYRAPLGGSDWDFMAGTNVTMISTSFAQVHNLAETGGSVVVDARIGFQNDTFRIQGYVKNLFDEDAVAQIIRYADADASFQRSFIAGLRPGRRFGVVAAMKF